MLRVVLRNVQYYLLFFSTLLVLLAFQRLQWYDQVWPNPYALDRPLHGGGRYHHLSSSPDNSGRIFYGGDESKEIGLFKFKLGLFKFVLPTFSKDDASWSWERTNELSSLMTVPQPPNRKRKSINRESLRVKAHSIFPHIDPKDNDGKGGVLQKASIAYVTVIPPMTQPPKPHPATNSKIKEKDEIIHLRATALSNSISRAHTNSPYKHKLYALIMTGGEQDESDSHRVHDSLVHLGFQLLYVNEEGQDKNGQTINVQSASLNMKHVKVLKQHDVIVHISLNSHLLKPMGDLFSALLRGDNAKDVMSIPGVKKVSPRKAKSLSVSSFALESMDSVNMSGELFLFRSNFGQLMSLYLEGLTCSSIQLKRSRTAVDDDVIAKSQKETLVLVARKIQATSQSSMGCLSNETISAILNEANSVRLDRCIYDAGNVDVGHDCSRVSVKDDARVAHLVEGRMANIESKIRGNMPNDANEISRGSGHCPVPWECLNDEGKCSKNTDSVGKNDVCAWLQSGWLSFVNNIEASVK
ncbi:hypothetical protein ACHAWF_004717 [Thalassiosira exigua]